MANNPFLPTENERAQLSLYEQIETALKSAFEAEDERQTQIYLDIVCTLLGVLRETVICGGDA